MKITLLACLISLILFGLIRISTVNAGNAAPKVMATCYGNSPCAACKNCKACKYCAKNGGKCGTCKKK